MSFPKAKIQRFNDIQNITPSPAEYNVSIKAHVTGAIIPKTDRFHDITSPVSSDNGSTHSLGAHVFRTPNPPVKGKFKSNVSKTKPTNLFPTIDFQEVLKEKTVECNNKDIYIKELTEQIEEMKQELSNREKDIEKLNNNKDMLETTLGEINSKEHNYSDNVREKFKTKNKSICQQILDFNDKINTKVEYEILKNQNKEDLTEIHNNLLTLQHLCDTLFKHYYTLIEEKTIEIQTKQEELIEIENKHLLHIDDLIKKHHVELQQIQEDSDKTIKDLKEELENKKTKQENALKQLQELKETEINKIHENYKKEMTEYQLDTEAKIKQLNENHAETITLLDIQMKEKCNEIERNCEIKLNESEENNNAILKECQAIAEYNVIECEVEKNKALYELGQVQKKLQEIQSENIKLKEKYATVNEKCNDLQIELDNKLLEIKNICFKSVEERKELQETIEQLLKEKRLFDLTVRNTHNTIEVLKKRLMDSDKDVEQFKMELEASEATKLEVEARCNHLTEQTQIMAALCDDIQDQTELNLHTSEGNLLALKEDLFAMIQFFEDAAMHKIKVLAEKLNTSKSDLNEAMKQLHNQQRLNSQAQELISTSRFEIERLESLIQQHAIKIVELEKSSKNLEDELTAIKAKEKNLRGENAALLTENNNLNYKVLRDKQLSEELLKDIYTKNEKTLYTLQQKIQDLENSNSILGLKIEEQNNLIGPFREHLEAYEFEKRILMDQKQNAEKEAKEIGMKFANILGHQNHKQKIKHLCDLKSKNIELNEEKKQLEMKVITQIRTIEKLKKELHGAQNKTPKKTIILLEEKENTVPNSGINSPRIDSPGGPLKDRN